MSSKNAESWSTSDKSPGDQGQALSIEKKKTKVLKGALKEMKKERAKIDVQLEKQNEQINTLNSQLQEKEKRYFDLYQEKMMLEETLIRENATKKITKRNIAGNTMGPPVTLVNNSAEKSQTPTSAALSDEKKESLSFFDVVKSPKSDVELKEVLSPDGLSRQSSGINMVPREQYDALKAKFIENETAAKKRLESIDSLEAQIKHREDQMIEMERVFNLRLEEQKDLMMKAEKEAMTRERMIRQEVKEMDKEWEKKMDEKQLVIDEINNELKEVRDKRDALYDEKYQVDAVVDEQKDKIEKLELDLKRSKEDVECRKMIIDQLGESIMFHEKESAEMASKLTLLKNQILENDADTGMNRKYTAVRIGTLRNYPCTFSFVQGIQANEFFMVVDSKQATTTINIDHVDQFYEDPDSQRLQLLYHVANEDGKLVKKRDEFEIAEFELLMKTFSGVRNKTVGLGISDVFTTTTISGSSIQRQSSFKGAAGAGENKQE